MTTVSQVIIWNGNVILDNAWLWRADHDIREGGKGHVAYMENFVENGIQIWGANVTGYGVAAEHSLYD